MRIANGVLALILIGFAAVQYNDPDSTFWMFIYGVGGFWTALAALAPRVVALKPMSMLLSFSVAAATLGVVYFWPDAPGWWRTEVWWETETAREGMGMMVVALALIAPVIVSIQAGNMRRREQMAAKEKAVEARRRSLLGEGALDA